MTTDGRLRYERDMTAYLKNQVSRAQALKVAGIGALAALGLPAAAHAASRPPYYTYPLLPDPRQTKSGRYTTENLTDILNIAQTAEFFAVTFLTSALNNASAIGLSGLSLTAAQAILAAEIAHVQVLSEVGATPLTTTFTIPDPKALSDYTTFWKSVEVADTIFVGAYLAAIREAAELNQPEVAKVAAQALGIEAEHRVLARTFLAEKGDTASTPPDNKGFETDLFLYVREAGDLLKTLGFIGGTGTAATFPGVSAAVKAAGPVMGQMIQLFPNDSIEGGTTPSNITAEHQ